MTNTIRAYGEKYAPSEMPNTKKQEAGYFIAFIFCITILGVIFNISVNILEDYNMWTNILRLIINILKIFSISLIKYYLSFNYDFGKLNIPPAYSFPHLNIIMSSFFPFIMI